MWTDQRLPDIINRKEFDESEKFAAKSDILRYELILQYGGVYMDTDFEPLRAARERAPIQRCDANHFAGRQGREDKKRATQTRTRLRQ